MKILRIRRVRCARLKSNKNATEQIKQFLDSVWRFPFLSGNAMHRERGRQAGSRQQEEWGEGRREYLYRIRKYIKRLYLHLTK